MIVRTFLAFRALHFRKSAGQNPEDFCTCDAFVLMHYSKMLPLYNEFGHFFS